MATPLPAFHRPLEPQLCLHALRTSSYGCLRFRCLRDSRSEVQVYLHWGEDPVLNAKNSTKRLVDPATLDALIAAYENKIGPRNGANRSRY